MNFSEDLVDTVEKYYPLPIAFAFKELRRADHEDMDKLLKKSVVLNEVLTKYLTVICLRSYFLLDGNNKAINSSLRSFQRPSHGQWISVLRDCSELFLKKKANCASVIQNSGHAQIQGYAEKISESYLAGLPGGEEDSLYLLVAKIKKDVSAFENPVLPSEDSNSLFKPQINCLLDFITEVRNKAFHGVGEIKLTREEKVLLLSALEQIFSLVLERLGFLSEVQLCFVKEVNYDKGDRYIHRVERAQGSEFEPEKIIVEGDRAEPGELYLFSLEKIDDSAAKLNWVLPLGPYMVAEQCDTTHSLQIFFFNTISKKKKIEYLSYGSGGHFSPDTHASDFDNINDFLEGRITGAELYRGKMLKKNLPREDEIVSREEREKCKALLRSAAAEAERQDYVLAVRDLKEAVSHNPDSAEAYFMLSMCLLAMKQGFDEAVNHLLRAIEIEPERVKFLMTLAEIYLVVGKEKLAEEYARRALRVEPSDKTIHRLLESIGEHGEEVEHV